MAKELWVGKGGSQPAGKMLGGGLCIGYIQDNGLGRGYKEEKEMAPKCSHQREFQQIMVTRGKSCNSYPQGTAEGQGSVPLSEEGRGHEVWGYFRQGESLS